MNKTNFQIDVCLFAGMCLLLIGPLFGVFFHVVLGLALALAVLIHLVLHRKWIAAAFRSAGGNPRMRRLRFINVLLAFCFTMTVVTGITNALTIQDGGRTDEISYQAESERGSGYRQGFNEGGPFGAHRGGSRSNHGHAAHHGFAILTFIVLIIHLAHHWSWIKTSARQAFSPSAAQLGQRVE